MAKSYKKREPPKELTIGGDFTYCELCKLLAVEVIVNPLPPIEVIDSDGKVRYEYPNIHFTYCGGKQKILQLKQWLVYFDLTREDNGHYIYHGRRDDPGEPPQTRGHYKQYISTIITLTLKIQGHIQDNQYVLSFSKSALYNKLGLMSDAFINAAYRYGDYDCKSHYPGIYQLFKQDVFAKSRSAFASFKKEAGVAPLITIQDSAEVILAEDDPELAGAPQWIPLGPEKYAALMEVRQEMLDKLNKNSLENAKQTGGYAITFRHEGDVVRYNAYSAFHSGVCSMIESRYGWENYHDTITFSAAVADIDARCVELLREYRANYPDYDEIDIISLCAAKITKHMYEYIDRRTLIEGAVLTGDIRLPQTFNIFDDPRILYINAAMDLRGESGKSIDLIKEFSSLEEVEEYRDVRKELADVFIANTRDDSQA